MGWLSKAWKGLRKLSNFLGLGIPNLIEKTLKKWLTPKIPDKEALKVPRQGSDQFIPVVYGTREVGAIVVDRNVTDQSGGADNEFLHVMCVFCYGEVDGFEEFYFGDVSWNDKRWLKDKNNPNGAKWFTYELRTGAAGQSAVNAVGKLNSFSSENSKYEGLAVAFFTFQQDKDQSIWQGEPQIKARIRGKKCLDPRTGVTAYTENPAIHLVDYLSNNIYSLGLTSEDYDIQSFINVANISDIEHTATIDTRVCKTEEGVYSCTGTPAEVVTFKRYSHNNIIDTQQSIFDNIQEIANCFRGYFPNSDGRLSVASEMEAGSVFSFNEDNMVSSITSEVPDRNSRFNRVIVRFPNKANSYEKDECVFPDADSQTEIDWLAEDNGTTQEKVLTVEYTVYKAEALQLARIAAYVSRYADTITFTATPEANILDVGDVFDVTDSTRGWDARLFRVSDIQYRDDGLVNITGVQHENAVYPWLGVSYTDIIGGSNLGDPSNIAAPFGLTITPDETFATAGMLSWESANDAFIRRFTVTVLRGEDVIYRTESLANNWPIPLLDAGDYSIQVRAVSTIGSLSPEAVIALTLTAPAAPTDIIFNASNFEINARPVLLGQGLGTTFEFAIDSESPIRGKGQTIVFTGLNFGTEYTVFARTVNALGISAWFSKSVSTTADSGPIIDLVGNDMYQSIFEPVVGDLQNQVNEAVSSIEELDTDLRLRISSEKASRVETDKALFDTAASAVQLRQALSNGLSGLTDAVFEVNPDTGLINLRAYSYTDTAFSQAGILIDGVAAEVDIQAERVTVTEQRITTAASQILAQAGKIELKASYTEVNEIVAGAIDAIIPAYSFGFFNSNEGWTAVNGTLTPSTSKILLTFGDIQNQSLSYSADENPVISFSIERKAGDGWIGDLLVTFLGGEVITYPTVIPNSDVGSSVTRVLNLSGEPSYTGTVTGIRFKFGATVADEFTATNITIGKPSAALGALDGITAQVNQLGINIDAVEGRLTNYVDTTFYAANSVTFNNLDVILDGADAIISLKATQQELDRNGTLTKANDASIWIDASESNITQVVSSYNAQEGGINDKISGINDQYNIVQSEIDASAGLIRDQSVSINRLGNKGRGVEKNAFYAAVQLLNQKNGQLAVGDAVAIADRKLQTVTNDVSSLSKEVLRLDASFGTAMGQLNAGVDQAFVAIANTNQATASAITSLNANLSGQLNAQSDLIQKVSSKADGTASSLASLDTKVTGIDGRVSSAQLILNSTVDELGVVSSRAFLGTTSAVNGVAVVNGIVIDGASNALEFKANTLRLTDTAGNLKLYWDSTSNSFVFNGRLVVGGYAVNSEADIRALDGDTIYERYQYSVDGLAGWHDTFTTGDLYRRSATVTNGVLGAWSSAAKIAGTNGSNGISVTGVINYYQKSSSATVAPTSWMTTVPALDSINKYLWNYEEVNYSSGNPTSTQPALIGTLSEDGSDGKGIVSITEWYLASASASGVTTATAGWATSPQLTDTTKRYLWNYEVVKYTIGADTVTAPVIIGTHGETGASGAAGLNNATVYLYQRAASTPSNPSANVTYTFATKAINGQNNGWLVAVPAGTNPLYVTVATASSASASDVIAPAEWSAPTILAQNGATGATGSDGANGLNSATVFLYQRAASAPAKPSTTSTYTFTTGVLTGQGALWTQSVPSGTNPLYVTTATAASTASTDTIASTEWATPNILAQNGIDGPQGVAGVAGANGVTTYTWIKYADSATGAGLSNNPTGKAYIGFAYNKTTATESNTASDYTWSLIQGPQGNTGVAGAPGADGQTTYTWIKYANVADGAGLYDTPTSATKYIGIAVNKTTATESTVKTDYTWSQFKGADGSDGATGATGAGFYGSTYAAISWTTSTANARFLELVGRNPVNLDIFTQTRQDGADSQARQYNGTSWVPVKLQVNGSIVASGTIAGDKLIAGTSISAPKIKGGSFELIGSTYFKYFSGTPFGPHSLIEWYGPKVNGLTWNATTLEPILAGMSKSNATSYTDATGKAYFGGGIIAGDFRNATTSTENSATATTPSLIFGSNGGLIDIVLTGNNRGDFSRSNTPSAGSGATSFTILLEKKISGSWVSVATLNGSGVWEVIAEGTDRLGDSYCYGSLTYTDSDRNTSQREYRARMTTRTVGSVPVKSQQISIVTSEVN